MSVLSRQKHEPAATVANTNIRLIEGVDNQAREKLRAAPLRNIHSLPSGRKDKVLAVRQLLAKGTYELDKRLDVVLDPLLADLTV
jgi:hypothetical protein